MKKVFEFFGKILGFSKEAVIQTAIEKGGEWVESFYSRDPENAKRLVIGLYGLIDTVGEDAAARSKKDWDDKAVDEAKEELEQFAASKGFELLNLDND